MGSAIEHVSGQENFINKLAKFLRWALNLASTLYVGGKILVKYEQKKTMWYNLDS